MEDTKTTLDNDIKELSEAVDKFLLKHVDTTESHQLMLLVDSLENLREANLLLPQDDYMSATYTSYNEDDWSSSYEE